MRLIVDGRPIEYDAGDSVLVAMLRADQHPTGGGCLCLGGDCMNCLATVDGVSYVRTCQVQAKPGMIVKPHPEDGYPDYAARTTVGAETQTHNLHCDVVVIGAGESGQQAATEAIDAGHEVIVLDAQKGEEVIGIYAGPLVVARTDDGMLQVHVTTEVIVATGAAEIQPVGDGSELAGLVTAQAATKLAGMGIDLGHVVAVGTPPEGISSERARGELVRFVGEGTVSAVITRDSSGTEHTYACDTVSLGLGYHPRNALLRMGKDLPVRAVGDCLKESDIPPCPATGMICPCAGVSVDDLDFIWNRGFQEMELVKRATLAGTGTCQGSTCLPYLRSFLQDRGKTLQPSFTARPVTKQLTIGEIAAGAHHHATPHGALHFEHTRLGAQMERISGWWRPWNYGNMQEEYWAVREAVSIGDVSTLGKMIVTGPDALAFLEFIYPTQVATIRKGRSRYVLMLNERGYVFDDGLIAKNDDNHYSLTFTSGGSSHAEMWMRDWAHGKGFDVRILNQTMALAAINVTGPLSNELLARVGLVKPPKYMRHTTAEVAGVDCKVFRLSFTGELSYELHHPAEDAVHLWNALMEAGKDLGIKPHGLEALVALRLEKGHIIVGQDSDFDSTPRRLHHEWMVKLDKVEDFLGKTAVIRTNKIPLDKMLVGFEMDDSAPIEGAVIWHKGEFAGHITSSTYAHSLGKAVMLGWLYYVDGELPTEVTINDRTARRVDVPFYDKEATRARA